MGMRQWLDLRQGWRRREAEANEFRRSILQGAEARVKTGHWYKVRKMIVLCFRKR